MEYLFAIIVGFLLTLLNAGLARWIAGYLVKTESAPIAGFSFALGAAGSIGSNVASEFVRNMTGIGAIIGLVTIWYLFFKRKSDEVSND